jgi:adenylate cyclase
MPLTTRKSRQLTRIAISLLVLMVFAMHVSGNPRFEIIDRMENYLYDVRVRLTMPGGVDDRVVIVDIDEASQVQLGQWPWDRDTLAGIIDILFDEYDVRALGFDVLFAEAGRSGGNDAFAESFIARNIVTGFVFKDSVSKGEPEFTGVLPAPLIPASDLAGFDVPFVQAAGYTGSLPALQENALSGGFFDSPLIDSDGVFRRAPLLQQYRGDLYPTLALALSHVALDSPAVGFRFAGSDRQGIDLEAFRLGDRDIPVNEQAAVFIPFRGPQESFRFVPARDVVNRTAPAEWMADKIVLVGASAAGLLDLRSTPVGQRYIGVEVHANLVAGLLDGTIRRQPAWSNGLEITLLFLIGALVALLLPKLSPQSSLLLVAAILLIAMAGNLWLWNSFKLVIPVASLIGYTLVAGLLQITYGFFVEQRNKRHLSQIFGQYIPPKLVEEIDASGEKVSLEGETRVMSVLFSDVRGFTTISEGLKARELTQMMNEFLTPFTRVIQENRGTIDKYMGDCVMAFWGAPLPDADHAKHALLAAFGMVRSVRLLDEPFAAKGWPSIRVGVGIASGEMNVGNMGSEFRIAYTVMGDTVNLGSRLEGLTKQYGVDIIVNAGTVSMIPDFTFRELDLVRVKGKNEPVAIYEPVGETSQLDDGTRTNLVDYVEALAAYRACDWDKARNLFEKLTERNNELLYNVYLNRIERFSHEPPPADWDGVFDHLSK